MSQPATRRRPPWWPEDEPWPPRGRPRFARRFARRGIAIAVGILLFLFIINAITWSLFHDNHRGGWPFGFFFFAFFAIVVITGAARAARRFTQPVGDLLDGVEQLAAGDYSARVSERGSGDIRELSGSFNELAQRLQRLESERRNLVADVSHELRTPLSVIRGNLEGMSDGMYAPDPARMRMLIDEVDVIARLVEDFQTLSQAEAGALRLHPENADLKMLAESVVAGMRSRAEEKGVVLAIEATPGPTIAVDAVRIREVLENLVANAIRHTPAGGDVSVVLRWPFGEAELSVRDTGSGISAEDLPLVFERYRKSPDSSGQGLGLPIAKRLIEAHGGTLEVTSGPEPGTEFRARIPVRT
jgi:two-component system sensor histidine kinase BaeS